MHKKSYLSSKLKGVNKRCGYIWALRQYVSFSKIWISNFIVQRQLNSTVNEIPQILSIICNVLAENFCHNRDRDCLNPFSKLEWQKSMTPQTPIASEPLTYGKKSKQIIKDILNQCFDAIFGAIFCAGKPFIVRCDAEWTLLVKIYY